MSVRLIVTDLDGTFLDESGTVPAANLAAAQEAVATGLKFVIATGRPTRWLSPLGELSGMGAVIIASNGACALSDGQLFLEYCLDPAVVTKVAAELRSAVPGVAFAAEYGDSWAREPGYRRGPDLADGSVAPLEELRLDGMLKLLVWHHEIATEPLSHAVEAVIGSRLTTTFSFLSEQGLVELGPPGVTKGTTLKELLTQWQIESEEIVAFGDMPNDLDLLWLAGHAYVPANAHPLLLTGGFTVIGHHGEASVGATIRQLLAERL